jgi:hypothetical protein
MTPTYSRERLRLEEIWKLQDAQEFVYQLGMWLHDKKSEKIQLNRIEHLFDMLCSMQSWIEMEGFCDLFYQQYSLSDCNLVEEGLKEIGADKLAGLFREAKDIYVRHNRDISEDEYTELDPLSLSEKEGARFDEIADMFYSEESGLFDLAPKLNAFAKKNALAFGDAPRE